MEHGWCGQRFQSSEHGGYQMKQDGRVGKQGRPAKVGCWSLLWGESLVVTENSLFSHSTVLPGAGTRALAHTCC